MTDQGRLCQSPYECFAKYYQCLRHIEEAVCDFIRSLLRVFAWGDPKYMSHNDLLVRFVT